MKTVQSSRFNVEDPKSLNVEPSTLNASDEGASTMPYKDPDPTDPNMLVGVVLPADAEATREMAYVFAEEFARFGYTREQLLWLFKNPFYGGAHGAYQALGESETIVIIDECLNAWGQAKFSILDFGFSLDGKTQSPDSISDDPTPGSKIQNPKSKI